MSMISYLLRVPRIIGVSQCGTVICTAKGPNIFNDIMMAYLHGVL